MSLRGALHLTEWLVGFVPFCLVVDSGFFPDGFGAFEVPVTFAKEIRAINDKKLLGLPILGPEIDVRTPPCTLTASPVCAAHQRPVRLTLMNG